ncbi:MAG: ThaI family type II restriction endonuclease [Nanoarchaeota archaeon]|nr:ThaI family type II restriction endonuclease [Nanoarchaeota archaeon]
MAVELKKLFTNKAFVLKIQAKLPKIFRITEIECSRAGKIGMEVGSLRERAVIALFIAQLGKEVVNTDIPITEPEADVIIYGKPVSIKTITANSGVKAVWTVDAQSAQNFINNYKPKCDIILVHIFWGLEKGGFYFIPLDVQNEIFNKLGSAAYLQMPKPGTNPRGVEFSKDALKQLMMHKKTIIITIRWEKDAIDYDVYGRWVDYWKD